MLRGFIAPEIVTSIRDAYSSGHSAEDIAREHGVSRTAVHKLTADLPQRNPTREARRLQIITCLAAGLDVRATSEKVGCKVSDVIRIVRAEDRADRRLPTAEELRAKRLDAKVRRELALLAAEERGGEMPKPSRSPTVNPKPSRSATVNPKVAARHPHFAATREQFWASFDARRCAKRTAAKALVVPVPDGLAERIIEAALPPEPEPPTEPTTETVPTTDRPTKRIRPGTAEAIAARYGDDP